MNEKVLELVKDVPRINMPDVVIKESESKLGYPFYFMEVIKKNDYIAYLDNLKACGFKECMEIGRPGGSYIRNATYRRGELFLSFRHGTGKSRMMCYLNPDYVEVDAEELFAEVPRMKEYGIVIHEPVQAGNGSCQIVIERTLKEHYERYLETLEKAGFDKYADNGDGLDGTVFNSVYTKGRLVVTVIYVKKTNLTYISACRDLPLSEHLVYQGDDGKENRPGAKTKLHMLEMWSFGNSFIFQLKNGHFLVSDGGMVHEVNYFLDYIESLVPKGERPVIEAWFISHAHRDHTEVLEKIGSIPELAERVIVEGIYFNEPSDCVLNMQIPSGRAEIEMIKRAAKNLITTKGACPKIYRPQTGQRYYFDDITVDVVLGQEQLSAEKYGKHDINDSSTWLMFQIEDQKCLLGGDGDIGGMDFVMHAYNKKYFEMDIMASLHHSGNSRNYFTDFCTVKTLLITRGTTVPERRIEEDRYLRASVQEWFSRAEGTRVLTFPYEIGSSEILPHFDWKYHPGQDKPNV